MSGPPPSPSKGTASRSWPDRRCDWPEQKFGANQQVTRGRKPKVKSFPLFQLPLTRASGAASGGCAISSGAALRPNYKTVHRRFQTWCCNEILRLVLTDVANELRQNGALDEEECFIDATFVMANASLSSSDDFEIGSNQGQYQLQRRAHLPCAGTALL